MQKLNSDNCMACGEEFSFEDLCTLVSTASRYRICNICLAASDVSNDYEQVRNIIGGYIKFAQQITDPELASPEIKIEPMESNIQKAVELLKRTNPSYFVGVRKIVVDQAQGNAFGYVASGGDNDPTVIHLNMPKIKAEIQSKIGSLPKEQQEQELVRQLAIVISHERAHSKSYDPKAGFVGGEGVAENEEKSMSSKIDTYYNTLK